MSEPLWKRTACIINDPAAAKVMQSIQERYDERVAALRSVCRYPENHDGGLKHFTDEIHAIGIERMWHEMCFLRYFQTRAAGRYESVEELILGSPIHEIVKSMAGDP